MKSVVGCDRKQPGCYSERLTQMGPQSVLFPWNCCPSHHSPHVLAWPTAEVQGLAHHFIRKGETHNIHGRYISVPDL